MLRYRIAIRLHQKLVGGLLWHHRIMKVLRLFERIVAAVRRKRFRYYFWRSRIVILAALIIYSVVVIVA